MNEDSAEKIEQQWFDSVRTDYYHQIQVINDVVLKSRVLLSFLIAATIPVFVVLRGVTRPIEDHELLSLIITGVILGFGIIAASYLWKALYGVEYWHIPQLRHFPRAPQTRMKWLEQHYRECADLNRASNKRRIGYMNKGANMLFCTVFLVLFLVLLSEAIRLAEVPMTDQPENTSPPTETVTDPENSTPTHERPAEETISDNDTSTLQNESFIRSEDVGETRRS